MFLDAADVLYDFGTGLEIISPLCPQLFLEMAGLGNFAKVGSLLAHFVPMVYSVACMEYDSLPYREWRW